MKISDAENLANKIINITCSQKLNIKSVFLKVMIMQHHGWQILKCSI